MIFAQRYANPAKSARGRKKNFHPGRTGHFSPQDEFFRYLCPSRGEPGKHEKNTPLNPSENQRIFSLGELSPAEFFGRNDENLRLIAAYFPKLKVVGRGNEVIALGEEEVLEEFEKKIERLSAYLHRYNSLPRIAIERILESDADPQNSRREKDGVILFGAAGQPIKAHSANQQKMVEAIERHDMLFAVGPAGTGKTYTGVALAVRALRDKQVRRIVLTRPAVEAGESLGFLPGDVKEKLDPYLQPLYDALRDMIPSEKLSGYMEKGIIQIAPLAYMRGRTLDGAFVILDEAQNTTPMQMKMFLTRMGPNAKFIITGDPQQADLPARQKSGLAEALRVLRGVKDIAFIQLDQSDVIRHRLVKNIIQAYQTAEQTSENI